MNSDMINKYTKDELKKIVKFIYPIAIDVKNMDFKKLQRKNQSLKDKNKSLSEENKMLKQSKEISQIGVTTREIEINSLDEQLEAQCINYQKKNEMQAKKIKDLEKENYALKKLKEKYEEEINNLKNENGLLKTRYLKKEKQFTQENEEKEIKIKLLEEENRNNRNQISQQESEIIKNKKKERDMFTKLINKFNKKNENLRSSSKKAMECIDPINTGIKNLSAKLNDDFKKEQLKEIAIDRLKKRINELVLQLQDCQNENIQLNNDISELRIQLKAKSKNLTNNQYEDISDLMEIKSFVNEMCNEFKSIQKESEKLEKECAMKDALIDSLKTRIVELTNEIYETS